MQPDHIVSYNTTLTCSIASAFNSDKAQETLFKHFKSAYLAQVPDAFVVFTGYQKNTRVVKFGNL